MKVGIAVDPQKRLAALRTGTPFRLSLAHIEPVADDMRATIIERTAHALLSAAHAHGEWFNVSAEEATAAVQQAIEDVGRQASKTAMAAVPIRLTPRLMRAARGLLNWTQAELAKAASLGVVTVRQFEAGGGEPRPATLVVLRQAFEKAGIEFIPENGGGAGLRMRKPAGDAAPQDHAS